MGHYIRSVRWLRARSNQVVSPSEVEIGAARRVLSRSPVTGYPPFTAAEVRLIGMYRSYLNIGGFDPVWPSIVAGDWNAWLFGIHEAAELQAFADVQADPFDATTWRANTQEAHLQATVFELQYLRAWSQQLEQETSEMALETENPIRGLLTEGHPAFVRRLGLRQGWPTPTAEEIQHARRFWQRIQKREQV